MQNIKKLILKNQSCVNLISSSWSILLSLLLAHLFLLPNEVNCMSVTNKYTQSSLSWTKYPDYRSIVVYMKKLERKYKGIVSIETIGESFEGREMLLLKLCNQKCGNKPAMWIDGGIHGREFLSPITVLYTINELLDKQMEHPELIEELDWYFLPVSNPDGYIYNTPFLNKCVNDFRKMWRKNRQPSGNNSSCIGTDLNRNWDFDMQNIRVEQLWKGNDVAHMKSNSEIENHCENSFQGLTPFSAPETRNMQNFILNYKDNIKFFNTIHCCAQILLMPWANTRVPVTNIEMIDYFAQKAVNEIAQHHHTELIQELARQKLADKLMTEIAIIHRNKVIVCTSSHHLKHSECKKEYNGNEVPFYNLLSPFDNLFIGIGNRFGSIEHPVNIDKIPRREVYLKYLTSRLNNDEAIVVRKGSVYLGIMSSDRVIRIVENIDSFNILPDLIKNVYLRTYEVGPVVPQFSKEAIIGTSMDWAYAVAKIPYTFTLELPYNRRKRYAMPLEQYIKTSGQEIWAFHKSAARQIIAEYH